MALQHRAVTINGRHFVVYSVPGENGMLSAVCESPTLAAATTEAQRFNQQQQRATAALNAHCRLLSRGVRKP